jgi:probable phosphoglycerate mutase
MTHLYLIRHGQALSATQGVVGNTRLSPLGVLQAERLRDRLAATQEIQADVLISSTMLRARHTAEIIAPALNLPISYDSEIEEWRDGDAEGMPDEEYFGMFLAIPYEQRPLRRTIPTSEGWSEFHLRIGTALHRIVREHEGKTIVLVCHGGVISASFITFFGINTLRFPRAFFNDTRNTSLTHWSTFEYADFPPSWSLNYFNDFTHIRDIDTVGRIPWGNLASTQDAGASRMETPADID